MLADFKCENKECAHVEELYFRSFEEMKSTEGKCSQCGSSSHRVYSGYSILPNEIAGYPKGAEHQTLGGAVDASKSKWY